MPKEAFPISINAIFSKRSLGGNKGIILSNEQNINIKIFTVLLSGESELEPTEFDYSLLKYDSSQQDNRINHVTATTSGIVPSAVSSSSSSSAQQTAVAYNQHHHPPSPPIQRNLLE
jgi:hypothetical protein